MGEVMSNVKPLNIEREMPFKGWGEVSLDEFGSSMQSFLSVPKNTILVALNGVYNYRGIRQENYLL